MNERTAGYALLIFGVGVMLFSAFNIVLVFTKHADPIQLFHTSPTQAVAMPKLEQPQVPGSPQTPDLSTTFSQLNSQTGGLFSGDSLALYSNLSAHFFLMGFVMTFGFKLATLGVQLLRPVYVKYNVKESLAKTPKEPTSPL